MKWQKNTTQMDFTEDARETFYEAVDDPYFRDRDSDLIYDALKKQMRLIPFGDYLKRYIYEKAEIKSDYRDIQLAEYQMIIRDSFSDHDTPASFAPTTARLNAMSKNWLTQQTVKRSVVLLLGFGLGMSVIDVNMFFTKALREQGLNLKDPMEVICWYCYSHGYSYLRFEELWRRYETLSDAPNKTSVLMVEQTVGLMDHLVGVDDDEDLMRYLKGLDRPGPGLRQSVAARAEFDALYTRAREIAAALFNDAEAANQEVRMQRLSEMVLDDDRLYDYEKAERLREYRNHSRMIRPEDITPGDIEKIICSAVPMGDHGNLMPAKASELSSQFAGKRFNRQHVGEILANRAMIDRFDLITLHFFIYAGDLEAHTHARNRYSDFIESTNKILRRCNMGSLYIANPYECFILMCLLSEDPMGTYADVWEVSYRQQGG